MEISQEMKDYVDKAVQDGIRDAMSFSVTKYGDTPTDALQLTPKKYVDAQVGGSPGGADTNVQFNDSGSFGGNANFTYNKTLGRLRLVNVIGGSTLDFYGSGGNLNLIETSGDLLIDAYQGDVILQISTVATNATKGFVYLASCNGTPTGVPANWSSGGSATLIFDISANKLWAYNGTWKSVTFT